MRADVWLAKITGFFHTLGAVLLALTVVVVLSGIGYRLLGIGFVGSDELAAIFGVLMVFMGIAYIHRKEKHVKVEVLTNLLNPRNRAIYQGFSYVAMIIICGVLIWQGFRLAIFAYVNQSASFFLDFPLYIIRIVILVGMMLFLAEAFCHIAHTVKREKKR